VNKLPNVGAQQCLTVSRPNLRPPTFKYKAFTVKINATRQAPADFVMIVSTL